MFLSRYSFWRVQFILDELKLWNSNIRLLLNCEFLHGFLNLSLNRLKNIFFKILNDFSMWVEIERMIDFNFVCFSSNFVYNNKINLGFNNLSFLLVNIYLSEFDFYIFFRAGLTIFLILSLIFLYFHLVKMLIIIYRR